MLFAAAFAVTINLSVKAQGDPGDPGDDPDRVPLDPGSWVLVAAGTGYGIKKLREAKRGSNKSESNATAKFINGQDTQNTE